MILTSSYSKVLEFVTNLRIFTKFVKKKPGTSVESDFVLKLTRLPRRFEDCQKEFDLVQLQRLKTFKKDVLTCSDMHELA